MSESFFEAPLLVRAGSAASINLFETPFFYNDHGTSVFEKELPQEAVQLPDCATASSQSLGNRYDVKGIVGTKTYTRGEATELELVGDSFVYQPLIASRENAAAFGITLVEPGQAVRVSSPVQGLSHIEYEYGAFAGYQSPYLDDGAKPKLRTVVSIDLECHDFPHVVSATDPDFPLVLSVARYWPKRKEIRLADLWLTQGHALYIPPTSQVADREYIDLHHNRNAARACWGDLSRDTVITRTLLQTEKEFIHWYWSKQSTFHPHPDQGIAA